MFPLRPSTLFRIYAGYSGTGLFLALWACVCVGCSQPDSPAAHAESSPTLESLPDSFQLGNITIYNAFKHQIEANRSSPIDSQRIVEEVYHRHRSLWEDCYGMIFGEENAPMFRTDTGMVAWNIRLYRDHQQQLDSLADLLIRQDVDSLFRDHMDRFATLGYDLPQARISLAFTPLTGVGFGGCANDQFVYELNNEDYDLVYTLEKGIPHEIYHLVDEEAGEQPTEWGAIDLSINEGLACYFVYDYFSGEVPRHEAVEGMTAEEWRYFADREDTIFNQMRPYFEDTSGDNPLLRNDRYATFPDAPRGLYYWMGFRIVESYLANHRGTTLRDLAALPYRDILKGSKYAAD